MGVDLCALVRRDHDDLDCALSAMVNPATPPKELGNLLEIFRLALAVHTATEARILDTLVERVAGPPVLKLVVDQCRDEHVVQRAAADALTLVRPGSLGWYDAALDLRALVIDHAGRAESMRWTLDDCIPADIHAALAREYAVERMRVLANTSPINEAQRRTAWRGPADAPHRR